MGEYYHVALTLYSWSEHTTELLHQVLQHCIKHNIPMITIDLPSKFNNDSAIDFFTQINNWSELSAHHIKTQVIGHWYDLPERVITPIKKVLESTKDYDSFFLTICLLYSGQQEITDAAKLLAKQVQLGRIDPEQITQASVKESLATSILLPPQLLIVCDTNTLPSTLLWDHLGAQVHFTNKPLHESITEIMNLI